MTGSTPFSIEESDRFNRSFKKLAKVHKVQKDKFVTFVTEALKQLIDDPFPNKSRREPLPRKIQLPEGWTFHKLELWFSEGASGQIRLMYLANATTYTIKLVWIYSHEQFAKRPADQDLNNVIRESLDG